MKLKSFWLRKKVKNAGKRQFLSLKHIEGGKKRLGNLLNIYWTRREYLYVKVFNFEKKIACLTPHHTIFSLNDKMCYTLLIPSLDHIYIHVLIENQQGVYSKKRSVSTCRFYHFCLASLPHKVVLLLGYVAV